MKTLTIAVLGSALAALAAALSFSGDAALLSVGVLGLLLVPVTWLSGSGSPFLRVFAVTFAGEYVLTGVAYVAVRLGWWPAVLAEAAPPPSLASTVAVFGLIVYLIQYIPVIRQIMGLADPYFASEETREVNFAGLVRRSMTERRFAAGMVIIVVVINQLQVAINVRLSFFSRDWFNAIQNKDAATFWSLLYTVFCLWAAIGVAAILIEFLVASVLKISWRRWLTERYYGLWLDDGSLYRASLIAQGTDNPDQRIAEDVKNFVNSTYTYSIELLSTVSSLVSFSIILWTIPAEFTIPGTGIVVPGLPFWVALIYAVGGTWLTHLIGKRLVRLDFLQERYEADFRFSLARLREYSEQVALLHGENAEKQILGGRFGALVANFYAIVYRTLKLLTFTQSYFQANVVIPYIIVAPYFFVGKLTLGQMTQTAGAFRSVESALTFFVQRYQSLATYKANVERLGTFHAAINEARALGTKPPRIEHRRVPSGELLLSDLSLSLPNGREIVRAPHLAFEPGMSTLLSGPSGSGKSTLFRAISGVWPYGSGAIDTPASARVMLLPQRPYIPSGTLKTAACYPATADAHADDRVREALRLARLEVLAGELDREDNWSQRLSGGEQQRLAIARAVLDRPDWLFLDEATAALDEVLEGELYRMLGETLPRTTIVSIGHRSTLVGLHRRHLAMQPDAGGVSTPVEIAETAPMRQLP